MIIEDILCKINRWWITGNVDKIFLYKKNRDEFNEIVELVNEKRILSIIGPKRVGKSTLLYQTANHLIKNNVNPKNILLFGCDEPGLFAVRTNLNDVIELYLKEILEEKIEELSEKVYILIDEIHFIEDWQLYLKSYYEKKYNIKFIISGSSSTHLFNKSKESLLGRIDEIIVLPLDFKQYTEFYFIYKSNEKLLNLNNNIKLLDHIEKFYLFLKSNYRDLLEYETKFNKILKEYLISGGYPEYFENTNILLWQKRLVEDIITKGIYRDIISVYRIKAPKILEQLLFVIAENQGNALSYSRLAQIMSIDTVTVLNYLKYLGEAFLIEQHENYSTNMGKIIRKNKKFYIIDNGIRNALLKVNEFNPAVEGSLIENCAVNNFKIYTYKNKQNLFYWRDGKHEVDLIVNNPQFIIPIEIKYRNNIELLNLTGLTYFNKKFKPAYSLVITKNFLNFENNVYYILFWMINL